MRKIILQIFVSLDGFIEDGEQSLDWMYEGQEIESYLNDVLRSVDGMIFGRKAHELLAQYWPTAGQDPNATKERIEAAALMNSMTKYVVTHGDYETDWEHSEIIGGDLKTDVERLKREPGGDLALFAGAGVAQSFIELGLVDAYRIVVNSVILGSGTPLFGPLQKPIDLKLTEARKFGSGAVILSYDPT